MQFEWDKRKATANLKKHKVAFTEAQTVFGDPLAKIFDDDAHSVDEKREIIIGLFDSKPPFARLFYRARN